MVASAHDGGNFDDQIAAIVKAGPLPLLEVLDMTPNAEHMDQDSWRRLGDLRKLWTAAPNLRTLRVKGSSGSDGGKPIVLGAIDAPRLERFEYESSGLDKEVPTKIGEATLPKLAHLELWLGRKDYGNTYTLKSFSGIFAGKGLPALETLAIKNSEWESDLIAALAQSAIVRRIKHLDLSMSVLCRDAAATLVEHAGAFAHLESINLDDNYLLKDHVSAIKRVLPNADFGRQREPEGDIDDRYSRYTSVGE